MTDHLILIKLMNGFKACSMWQKPGIHLAEAGYWRFFTSNCNTCLNDFLLSILGNSGKVMFVPIRRQIPSGCPFPLASNSPDIGFFSTNNIRLRDFLIYCDIKKIGRDVYCLQIGRTYTVFFIFYQERDLIRVTDILPIETAHKRYNHFV